MWTEESLSKNTKCCTNGSLTDRQLPLLPWQLFRFPDMEDLKLCFGSLFAQYPLTELPYTWKYYFDARIIFLMIVGTLGSTLFGWEKLKIWCKKATSPGIGFLIQELVIFVLFIVAILCMVNSTYSPFYLFPVLGGLKCEDTKENYNFCVL